MTEPAESPNRPQLEPGSLTRPGSVSGRVALARLEAERVLIQAQLAGLRHGFQEIVDASADSNGDDEHDPEGSTIAFERSQVKALIHQAERHLGDIEDARVKVAEGGYGMCESCGRRISDARLDARPVARTCIACAAIAT
jgi:DnaK suppressor protein